MLDALTNIEVSNVKQALTSSNAGIRDETTSGQTFSIVIVSILTSYPTEGYTSQLDYSAHLDSPDVLSMIRGQHAARLQRPSWFLQSADEVGDFINRTHVL